MSETWPYGGEAAAQVVAAMSWPWERRENREGWAPKMLTDRDLAEREIARAEANLAAATEAIRAHCRITHPASPSAQCRGEGRGGAVSEELGNE